MEWHRFVFFFIYGTTLVPVLRKSTTLAASYGSYEQATVANNFL